MRYSRFSIFSQPVFSARFASLDTYPFDTLISSATQTQEPALDNVPPIVRAVLTHASYERALVVDENNLVPLVLAELCNGILQNWFRKAEVALGAIKDRLM